MLSTRTTVFATFATLAFARTEKYSEDPITYGCQKFKEFVLDEYDCDQPDFNFCKNKIGCDRYVCDGSSNAEKSVSKGGLYYELQCGEKSATYDTWDKICALERNTADSNSSIKEKACEGEGDGGCDATLKLFDNLSYEWSLLCGRGLSRGEGKTCYEGGRCF